ncbi:MAG: response regulator [Roseburia sp.]
MLKVLLVDDEPFILEGLKLLVDWEREGFEIAGTAANGVEALNFLQEEEVDLIIADIKMPQMTGLELLERIRKENLSDAYFVILSGYAEFGFAQQALQNDCTDYILKPVDGEILLKVLNKVFTLRSREKLDCEKKREMEQAYLARHIIALVQGKFDNLNLEYVREHMRCGKGVRYVEIQMEDIFDEEGTADREMRVIQRKLYNICMDYLKEDANLCVFDVSVNEKIYDIGLLFFDYVAEKNNMKEKEYLENFLKYLNANIQKPIVMLVGKKVQDISNIARSYGNTCMLRSFQGFRAKKSIYYYEEEVQVSPDGIVLCKQSLDGLLKMIEQNNHVGIRNAVESFYEEMGKMGICGETMTLNINYLLFQLIHLASEQDDDVNQEEILRLISESSFETGVKRGSKAHLARFACEYAEYLSQLRKNVSRGVLGMVEKEIKDNFASNITLRSLSEKYYVNSAYLGQLFRKKYGKSFKDYLNNYRMEQAANFLIHTDKKIAQIAEDVGYHDLDYFVNRFIQVHGCTPARFRKKMIQGE